MKIKDLDHFKQIVEIYQNGFGSAMFDINGVLYGAYDLYKILSKYMEENNINTISLPKGINWGIPLNSLHNYVLEFSVFKPSGKYYHSNSINLFESNTDKWVDDFPKLHKLKEDHLADLDKACGLNPGSIEANNFTVLVQILDLNANDQSCFRALIR